MTADARQRGMKSLRFAALTAVAGLAVAVFLVAGSYYFWQAEKRSDLTSQNALRDLQARLATLKRERDDLRGSEETYRTLVANGAFVPERRLDFIEAMAILKKRHQLQLLEYEVSPQRPLRLASGAAYSAVQVMASRIKLRAEAYHDGDLIAFLDEFPGIQRGFFPMDRCVIQRLPGGIRETDAGEAAPPRASLKADCTLEWITLVDKAMPAAPVAGQPGRPG